MITLESNRIESIAADHETTVALARLDLLGDCAAVLAMFVESFEGFRALQALYQGTDWRTYSLRWNII